MLLAEAQPAAWLPVACTLLTSLLLRFSPISSQRVTSDRSPTGRWLRDQLAPESARLGRREELT